MWDLIELILDHCLSFYLHIPNFTNNVISIKPENDLASNWLRLTSSSLLR